MASQIITVDASGTTINWQRNGASPVLSGVRLSWSAYGQTYQPLGQAHYDNFGWHLKTHTLPRTQTIFINTRGTLHAGQYGGSQSPIEAVSIVNLPLYRIHLPLVDVDFQPIVQSIMDISLANR